MNPSYSEPESSAGRLGLWDTTSMLVGIIIGVGIYVTPSVVFRNVNSPWLAIGLWVGGGLLCLVGAFCFAELASTYSRSGGEYVYLTRAFGSWMGFLFAWAQLLVVRTGGSIAIVAYIFADYAGKLLQMDQNDPRNTALFVGLAALPIIVLTAMNMVGVAFGKTTQNVLTVLKVLGLAGILVAGFCVAAPATGAQHVQANVSPAFGFEGLALAMTAILWSYSGWHEGAYVIAEVRDRKRTLPLALLLGTAFVMVIYIAINLAYLGGLGFEEAGRSKAVAADVVALALGQKGAWVMSLLVIVSALGCLNGMIFTSSRIFAEMGKDHPLFAPLGWWHAHWKTPVLSLLLQGTLCLAAVVVAGLCFGGQSGLEALLKYTAAVFWVFFLLTGVALFVLRFKDPHLERPFAVPAYPFIPLLFCGCCAFMIYGSVQTFPWESLVGLGIVATGLPLYYVSRMLGSTPNKDKPRLAPACREHLVETGDRA